MVDLRLEDREEARFAEALVVFGPHDEGAGSVTARAGSGHLRRGRESRRRREESEELERDSVHVGYVVDVDRMRYLFFWRGDCMTGQRTIAKTGQKCHIKVSETDHFVVQQAKNGISSY